MFLNNKSIVDDLLNGAVDDECLEQIKQTSYISLIQFHHSFGRWLRNRYDMWNEKNPYSKINPEPNENGFIDDSMHPDQRSMEVIKMLWERLNK